jgi:hypothetical protein
MPVHTMKIRSYGALLRENAQARSPTENEGSSQVIKA